MKVAPLVLSVVAGALTSAGGSRYGNQGPRGQGGQFPSARSRYSFQWDVNDPASGNYYGHQEQRNGDNTQGNYYVHLTDGSYFRVQYTVGETRHQPVLTTEGEASYPPHPSRSSALQGTHPLPPLAPSGGTSTVSRGFSNRPLPSHSNPATMPGRFPPHQYQPVARRPGATSNDNNLPSTRPDVIPAPISSPGLLPPPPLPGQGVVPSGPRRPSAYTPLYPSGAKPQGASSLPFARSTSFNTVMHSVLRHPSSPAALSTHKPKTIPPRSLIPPTYFIPPSSLTPPSPLATVSHSVKTSNKFPPFSSSPSKDSAQERDTSSSVFFSPKKRSTLRPDIYPSTSHSTSIMTSKSVPPRHRSVHSLGSAPLLPRRNVSSFIELASLPPGARPYALPSRPLSVKDDSVHRQHGFPENHPRQSILPPRRPIPTMDLFNSGLDSLPTSPLTSAGGSRRRPGMLPSSPLSPARRLTAAPPPPRYNLILLAEALALFPDRIQ